MAMMKHTREPTTPIHVCLGVGKSIISSMQPQHTSSITMEPARIVLIVLMIVQLSWLLFRPGDRDGGAVFTDGTRKFLVLGRALNIRRGAHGIHALYWESSRLANSQGVNRRRDW